MLFLASWNYTDANDLFRRCTVMLVVRALLHLEVFIDFPLHYIATTISLHCVVSRLVVAVAGVNSIFYVGRLTHTGSIVY